MILNINKPLNWTSSDVVRKMKSLLNMKKIGHAGTLDPLATGVLIVLTESDTKKQEEIMQMEKEYIFEMCLGVASVTYDMEGPFTLCNEALLAEKDLDKILGETSFEWILSKYRGKIKQKVPAYSAVKINGRPLYKSARNSSLIKDLPLREIEIYDLAVLSLDPKKKITIMGNDYFLPHIRVKVLCSKGTYIRSLAHDIGQDIGCGAVVTELNRTRVGHYRISDSLDLLKTDFSNFPKN